MAACVMHSTLIKQKQILLAAGVLGCSPKSIVKVPAVRYLACLARLDSGPHIRAPRPCSKAIDYYIPRYLVQTINNI